MIRINLFFSQRNRQVRKTRRMYQEALAGLGILALTVTLCGVVMWMMNRSISDARQENQVHAATLALLTQQAKDVQAARATREGLQTSRRLWQRLASDQILPLHILEELSRRIDPHAVWLVRLQMAGLSLEMDGTALTRKAIVQFAENLRQAGLFQLVTIKEMRATPLPAGPRFSFAIQIRLTKGLYDSASRI